MPRLKYLSLIASSLVLMSITGCTLVAANATVLPQNNIEVDSYFASWLDAQNDFSRAQTEYEIARQGYYESLPQRDQGFDQATYHPDDLVFKDAIAEIKQQTALFRARMEPIRPPTECAAGHILYLALLDLMIIFPDGERRLVEDVHEFGYPLLITMEYIYSLQIQIDKMRADILETEAICV